MLKFNERCESCHEMKKIPRVRTKAWSLARTVVHSHSRALLILSLIFCAFSPAFSDDLTRERVLLLENQALNVGVGKIDTYQKVFACHDDMYYAVVDRTGIYPDYYALSFKTSQDNKFVLSKSDPYRIVEEFPGDKYLFTVPVIYDYCVMISRIEDKLEVQNDIQNKTYVTFKSDILSGSWCKEFGLTRFDQDNLLGASAFQKIVDGEADLIFMPERLARVIIDFMDFRDQLYVSRPFFEISYRFAFTSDHQDSWVKLNAALVDMINSGELEEICHQNGVSQSLVPKKNIQRELMSYVILFLIATMIVNIAIVIISLRKMNKAYIENITVK